MIIVLHTKRYTLSKLYRINYYSKAANYSDYLPTVEKMIHSFNIINATQLKNSDTKTETTNLPKYKNATLGIGVIYPVNWTIEDGYYNRTAEYFDIAKGPTVPMRVYLVRMLLGFCLLLMILNQFHGTCKFMIWQ